jgi:hypothetical protein
VVVESQQVAVESILAKHMVKRAVYVSPVLIVVFAIASGWSGAWSSALGSAVVVGNFLLAGAVLSVAARISLSVYHAAALFGFFLRLALIGFSILLITRFADIDRFAFGITTVVAYMVLLSWEAVAVSKGRERNLDWTR